MAREGSNIIPFDDAWRRSSLRRDSYRPDASSRRSHRDSFGSDAFDAAGTDARFRAVEQGRGAYGSEARSTRPSREAYPLLGGEFPADPAWLDRIDGGVKERPAHPDRTVRPGRERVRSSFSESAEQAPRAAVEVYDEDQQDQEERGRSRAERKKKQKSKEKAERMFARQFGSEDKASGEGGSRAAVYKGEMGRSHKRAFEDLGGSTRGRRVSESSSRAVAKEKGGVTPKLVVFVSVMALLVFAVTFLYPPARQYYLEMRTNAQLQAEFDALSERNQAIQEEIDHLSTDEGVQDEAREQLGWVQEGEVAVVVEGLEEEPEEEAVRAQIASGSVPAPTTWYSPVLDVVFGYHDPSKVDTTKQDAAATVDDAGVQESQEQDEAQAESSD